jgi:hypothetical protein
MHTDHKAGASASGLAAPQPAELTTQKGETHRLAGAMGFEDNSKADIWFVAYLDAERKVFTTLRARLALAGWTLSRAATVDGATAFLAIRWNMPRELASLDAMAAFADMVGAPA